MTIKVLDWELNYIDKGEGETLLFLHGWGAAISLYQPLFDRLLAKGYRVVAFDMPGVGGTPDPRRPLTVEDYLALTLEFCRKLEIGKAVLMCHSHGGRIVLPMLADPACPVQCKKAVLIDSTGVRPKPTPGGKVRLTLYKAARVLGTNRVTKPLFGALYEEMRNKRASADYKAATPVMRKTMSNVLPADFTRVMPNIKASVLLIWGENDTATPLEHGRTMERLIPGAGLAVIRAAGHFSFADNPAQFYAVLDAFL